MPSFDDGPTEIDWPVHSADDWWKTFTVKDGGVAIDVSGWTFAGSIVKERNSSITIATLEWDLTNAASGVVSFGLSYPSTILGRASHWYELELANPRRHTFQEGLVIVGFDHSELVP